MIFLFLKKIYFNTLISNKTLKLYNNYPINFFCNLKKNNLITLSEYLLGDSLFYYENNNISCNNNILENCKLKFTKKDFYEIENLINLSFNYNFHINNNFIYNISNNFQGLNIGFKKEFDIFLFNNFTLILNCNNEKLIDFLFINENNYFIKLNLNEDLDFYFSIKSQNVKKIKKKEFYFTKISIFLLILEFLILIFFYFKFIKNVNEFDLNGNLIENGWKVLHGDIFRNPKKLILFTCLTSNGFKLFLIFLTLFFVVQLSDTINFSLIFEYFFLLYFFYSIFLGYYSTKFYKTFGKQKIKKNNFFSNFLIKILLIIIILIYQIINSLNFIFIIKKLFIILIGSYFLYLIGSLIGLYCNEIEFPTKTHIFPRNILKQPIFNSIFFSLIISGFINFMVFLDNLKIIINYFWKKEVFIFNLNFFFLNCFLLLFSSIFLSLIFLIIQLRFENYKWWWKSFLCPGFCSFFSFLYLLKNIYFQSIFLGVIFSFSISFIQFLICGYIGFYSSLNFINILYSCIKFE